MGGAFDPVSVSCDCSTPDKGEILKKLDKNRSTSQPNYLRNSWNSSIFRKNQARQSDQLKA